MGAGLPIHPPVLPFLQQILSAYSIPRTARGAEDSGYIRGGQKWRVPLAVIIKTYEGGDLTVP